MRRLSLVRVHRVTDIAIFALAEHALDLERLNLSYCDALSLDALHLLLNTSVLCRYCSVRPLFRRCRPVPVPAIQSSLVVDVSSQLDSRRRVALAVYTHSGGGV